jgi:hypothetical protein
MRVLEKVRIVFRGATVDEKVIDLSLASDFKDQNTWGESVPIWQDCSKLKPQ